MCVHWAAWPALACCASLADTHQPEWLAMCTFHEQSGQMDWHPRWLQQPCTSACSRLAKLSLWAGSRCLSILEGHLTLHSTHLPHSAHGWEDLPHERRPWAQAVRVQGAGPGCHGGQLPSCHGGRRQGRIQRCCRCAPVYLASWHGSQLGPPAMHHAGRCHRDALVPCKGLGVRV